MGVSARAAARELGMSHTGILAAAKSGRITREKDGSYDVAIIRKQLTENTNAKKRHRLGKQRQQVETAAGNLEPTLETLLETDDGTLAEAQRRREWVRLEKEKLALARERAELAPIGEINAWVAGMIIRARDILTRIAPELKDRLAQQGNPHECEKLVAGEVNRALRELAEFKPSKD